MTDSQDRWISRPPPQGAIEHAIRWGPVLACLVAAYRASVEQPDAIGVLFVPAGVLLTVAALRPISYRQTSNLYSRKYTIAVCPVFLAAAFLSAWFAPASGVVAGLSIVILFVAGMTRITATDHSRAANVKPRLAGAWLAAGGLTALFPASVGLADLERAGQVEPVTIEQAEQRFRDDGSPRFVVHARAADGDAANVTSLELFTSLPSIGEAVPGTATRSPLFGAWHSVEFDGERFEQVDSVEVVDIQGTAILSLILIGLGGLAILFPGVLVAYSRNYERSRARRFGVPLEDELPAPK